MNPHLILGHCNRVNKVRPRAQIPRAQILSCQENFSQLILNPQGSAELPHLWKKGGTNCDPCGLNCDICPVKITNVLAATQLGCTFDLGKLANQFSNTVYNPRKMKCVVWNHRKIGGKQVVALVFATGYLSVNGSKTVVEGVKHVRKYARALQKHGYEINYCGTSIQAVSAVATLPEGNKPNLDSLASNLSGVYEPELFTAACLKFHRMSFLVFASGKIVITGIRNNKSSHNNVRKFLSKIFDLCIGI